MNMKILKNILNVFYFCKEHTIGQLFDKSNARSKIRKIIIISFQFEIRI